MYCSTCGNQLDAKLNYCNHCGARISELSAEIQKTVARNLSESLGYIGGFGLLGVIFLVFLLLKFSVAAPVLISIAFFYLAALFGICFLILRQTGSLSRIPKEGLAEDARVRQLSPAETARLDAPRDSPASVTDATTREMEEILVERR